MRGGIPTISQDEAMVAMAAMVEKQAERLATLGDHLTIDWI